MVNRSFEVKISNLIFSVVGTLNSHGFKPRMDPPHVARTDYPAAWNELSLESLV